jgi:hypothetical protein
MQSFKTMYRFMVMAATLAIIAMLWRLYGPPAEQAKSIAWRAVEWAHGALRPAGELPIANQGPATLAAEPFGAAPLPVAAPLVPAPLVSAPLVALPVENAAADPISGQSIPVTSAAADPLQALLAQLEQLGVVEQQLVPWGAERQLVRFTCRATWGESPSFTQHFESVAAEPLTAVQEVLAEVSAWRLAKRGAGGLR